MRRFICLLTAVLLLAHLPFAACADETGSSALSIPRTIEEGAFTVSLPADFISVRPDFDPAGAEAASLSSFSIDTDNIADFFEENPEAYMYGYSKAHSVEFNIVVMDSRTAALSTADLEALKADYLSSILQTGIDADSAGVESYIHEQTPFIEATFCHSSLLSTTYCVQYYTVCNYKSVCITFMSDSAHDLSFLRGIINSIRFTIDSRPTGIISALNSDAEGSFSAENVLLSVFAVYLLISVSFSIIRRHTMTEKAASTFLMLLLCVFLILYTVISLCISGRFVLRFEYLIVPALLNIALTKLLAKKEEKPSSGQAVIDTDELIP